MKKIIAVFLIAGLGLATTSCFQRSCPTYAKEGIKTPIEQATVTTDQKNI